MKKRAAMLLAGMMVLSLAVPCAAGAEETNEQRVLLRQWKGAGRGYGKYSFLELGPKLF